MKIQNAQKNTKFDGWEKYIGRKQHRKNMDEKYIDEKAQNSMVGKNTWAENHTKFSKKYKFAGWETNTIFRNFTVREKLDKNENLLQI